MAALAPPEAAATLRSFLGDVPMFELGSTGSRQARFGPLLALEYVRRAVAVSVTKPPGADVVVAASHFHPDAAAVARLARRGTLGVAYVYHLVAGRRGRGLRTLWSKSDERVGLALLKRFAGVVFTSNRGTEAALAARGFTPVHTAVGVDLASFRRAKPSAVGPRATFIARMARTKGVTDAVEAWARVRAEVPDASLTMVGTGPERERARAVARQLGIAAAIDWRGFVSEDEKREILAQSRLLLAPSYEEGWGIAVCEGLASAVPVVAYRHPVLDELFGDAYIATERGDVAGLAERAVRVLRDNAVADEYSRRGIRTAERYDVMRVAEQELDVILRAKCAS